MENNIHRQGINKLPDPTSFQRRNSYNSKNPDSPQADNMYKNRFQQGPGFQSVDGRRWKTKDYSFIANKETYNKIGRDISHRPENPESFNLTNFNRLNKD